MSPPSITRPRPPLLYTTTVLVSRLVSRSANYIRSRQTTCYYYLTFLDMTTGLVGGDRRPRNLRRKTSKTLAAIATFSLVLRQRDDSTESWSTTYYTQYWEKGLLDVDDSLLLLGIPADEMVGNLREGVLVPPEEKQPLQVRAKAGQILCSPKASHLMHSFKLELIVSTVAEGKFSTLSGLLQGLKTAKPE